MLLKSMAWSKCILFFSLTFNANSICTFYNDTYTYVHTRGAWQICFESIPYSEVTTHPII